MSTATLATEEAAYDLVPEHAEPAPTRPRVLLIGTALAGAAIITLFATLIGTYLRVRHDFLAGQAGSSDPMPWLADGNPIPLTPSNIALGTMLLSCISMQWAVDAVKNNDRRHAIFGLVVTIMFGAAVINATSFIYTQTGLPVAGSTNAAGLLFYVVTGTHLALIVGALVFVALMTFRTIGGEYSRRDHEGIVAASLIWYLTAALHAVIWYAVYVTK